MHGIPDAQVVALPFPVVPSKGHVDPQRHSLLQLVKPLSHATPQPVTPGTSVTQTATPCWELGAPQDLVHEPQ